MSTYASLKKNNNSSINDFIQIGLSVVPKSIYTHTAFPRASSEFPTVQTQDVLNSEDLAKEGCSHGALILALQHREHYWCYQTVRHRVGYKVVVISSLCNSGPKPQKDLLVHVLILLQNILWFSAKNKRTTATPKPSHSSPFGTGQRNDRPGRSCEVSHPVPLRSAPRRRGRAAPRTAAVASAAAPQREAAPARPGSPGAPAPPRVLLAAAAAAPRRRARRAFFLLVLLLRGHADLHRAAAGRKLRAGGLGLLRPGPPGLPLRHGAPLLPRQRSPRARARFAALPPPLAALPPAPGRAAARPPLLLSLAAGGSPPPGGARPGLCGRALSCGGSSAGVSGVNAAVGAGNEAGRDEAKAGVTERLLFL